MSDGGAPGAYFVGRPVNKETETANPQAGNEQNQATGNSSAPGDYFQGRPGGQQEQPASQAEAKKGFLAWCSCLGGSEVAK